MDATLCPRCGKFMIRRKSSNGEFWGCSAFPFCKEVVSIGAEPSVGLDHRSTAELLSILDSEIDDDLFGDIAGELDRRGTRLPGWGKPARTP